MERDKVMDELREAIENLHDGGFFVAEAVLRKELEQQEALFEREVFDALDAEIAEWEKLAEKYRDK